MTPGQGSTPAADTRGCIKQTDPGGTQQQLSRAAYPLQGFFAARLALPQSVLVVVDIAVALQVLVLLRAPLIVVHAVHNASELPAAVPEDGIQPPAPLLGLAFPGIPAA